MCNYGIFVWLGICWLIPKVVREMGWGDAVGDLEEEKGRWRGG
jgi:hypothetical protein